MTAVIIVAMEKERVHLEALMPGWELVPHDVWTTRRNGDVVCITCGVGMIAAAAATEHAIREYAPEVVLNFGCTGAHVRDIWPGDVVIGTSLVHQGRLRFGSDGSVNTLPFGFTVPGDMAETQSPSCDPDLVRLAEVIASDLDFPAWPPELRPAGQPDRAPEVRTGPISSGDVWLQHATLIDTRHQETGSLCEDMEAAAIGQICTIHRVPFLTVKDISNSEFHALTEFGGGGSGLPINEVGKRSAMLIAAVIDKLATTGSVQHSRI